MDILKKEQRFIEKYKNRKKEKFIAFILLIVFVTMMCISDNKIIVYIKDSKQNEDIFEEIGKDIVVQNIPDDNGEYNKYKIDFASLREKNSDTVRFFKSE